MTTIVHISDTHFGTEVPPVVEALRQTINNLKPGIVILTGDITQRARPSQFKAAADFLDGLSAKTKLVIPGNHDIPLFNIWSRFMHPYRNYKKFFGAREAIWNNGDLGIICYDATSAFRHTRGKLLKHSLLKWINQLKKHLNSESVIIACAHQPLETAWPQDQHETLINRKEIAHIWSEHKIDLVLSGHVHVPMLATTQKTFPALPTPFILAGAGTAISYRIRPGAPNSFNVITITREEKTPLIAITHYFFEKESCLFKAHHPVYFIRTAQGWQEKTL